MRKLFIYLSLIIFSSTSILADKLPTQPSEIDILISKIKNTKAPDKRVLMNQLKVKLREMNQETRTKAMINLRKSFNKSGKQSQTQKNQNAQMHQNRENQSQQMGQRGMQNRQHKGKR